MSVSMRIKKLDGPNKVLEMYVKSEIVNLDGTENENKIQVPFEEIQLDNTLVFRVREDYCTPERLADICQTVGELKRCGQIKQSAIVVPEWIEVCKLCPEPEESTKPEEALAQQ